MTAQPEVPEMFRKPKGEAVVKTDELLSPGIYRGWSFDKYRAVDAMNHSRLDKGLRSMAHLKAAIDSPDDLDSRAADMGTALHHAVLEPDLFAAGYETGPLNAKTGEPYGRDTKAFAEWRAANPDARVIGPSDLRLVMNMREAIMAHPKAGKLCRVAREKEASVVWTDPETGVLCKARMDAYVPAVIGLDLKTTDDADPEWFWRAALRFGYHRQLAWYEDGFRTVDGKQTDFLLVIVENSAPHGVVIARIPDSVIAAGRSQNRRLLRQYARCLETGVWPGYPTDVIDLSFPDRASRLDGLGLPLDTDTGPF